MATPRLMIVLIVATGVVVAAYSLRRAGQTQDKPDPVAEARIEEERLEANGR